MSPEQSNASGPGRRRSCTGRRSGPSRCRPRSWPGRSTGPVGGGGGAIVARSRRQPAVRWPRAAAAASRARRRGEPGRLLRGEPVEQVVGFLQAGLGGCLGLGGRRLERVEPGGLALDRELLLRHRGLGRQPARRRRGPGGRPGGPAATSGTGSRRRPGSAAAARTGRARPSGTAQRRTCRRRRSPSRSRAAAGRGSTAVSRGSRRASSALTLASLAVSADDLELFVQRVDLGLDLVDRRLSRRRVGEAGTREAARSRRRRTCAMLAARRPRRAVDRRSARDGVQQGGTSVRWARAATPSSSSAYRVS